MADGYGLDDLFGCSTVSEPSVILSDKNANVIPSYDSISVLPYNCKVEVAEAPSTCLLTPSVLKVEGKLIRTRLDNFFWESWKDESKSPGFKLAICVVGFPSFKDKSGGQVAELIGQVCDWEELHSRCVEDTNDPEGLKIMFSDFVDDLNEQKRSFIGDCIPDLVKARLEDGLLPVGDNHKNMQRAINAAYWWQRFQGGSDIAVGYREFGEVVGFCFDYAGLLIKKMISEGYLHLVSKGRPGRQSRYRFIGREENGVLMPAVGKP